MADERTPPAGPGHWEQWTHLSHRYVMPVAAGTALTFGSALLADFQPGVVRYLPELLIAVGAVALSTSFAFLVARRREAALRAAAAAHAPFRRTHPLRPPVVRPEAPSAIPSVRGGSPWSGAYSRTAGWNGSLAVSSAGDALWSEWLPMGIDELGAEVVGPVPETLYLPTASDPGPVISRRDDDLVFLEQFAEGSEGDEPPNGLAPSPPQGWSSGSLAFPDIPMDPVELEALNAVPPYLRFSAGLERRPNPPAPTFEAPAPVIAASSEARSSCSTCLVTLGSSRWQPCPGCYEPICTDCVVDSLASYGATGCAGCVQGRPLTP